MRMILSLAAAIVAGIFLSACQSAGPSAAPVSVEAAAPYQLDSGDKVRIDVFGQPDMSGEQTVDGSGNVTVPLLGLVEARGVTVDELRGRVVERLSSSNLLVNPSVNVQVVTYRPFFILGEVRQPGQFPYVEGMTVLTAVAISGGFTFRADQDSFTVTRKTGSEIREETAQRNSPVRPGDVIYVRERFF